MGQKREPRGPSSEKRDVPQLRPIEDMRDTTQMSVGGARHTVSASTIVLVEEYTIPPQECVPSRETDGEQTSDYVIEDSETQSELVPPLLSPPTSPRPHPE